MRKLMLVIFVVGLLLRSLSITETFTDQGIEFLGTDSYYHALRTVRLTSTFPMLDREEPWLHYPEGATLLYPGGFHLLAAAVARLTGQAGSSFGIRAVCALMPLLFYGLIFVALARLTRRDCFFATDGHAGKRLVALGLFALMPPAIKLTSVGAFDHHPLESLFLMVTLLLTFDHGQPTKRRTLVAGAILGFMPLFWVQSPLFLGLFVLASLYHGGRFGVCVTGAATVIYLLLVLGLGDVDSLDANALSAAQPAIGLVFTDLLLLRYAWSRRHGRAGRIAGLVFLLMLPVVCPLVYLITKDTVATLLATNPFLVHTSESAALQLRDLPAAIGDYGLLTLAAPLLFLFGAMRPSLLAPRPERRAAALLLFVALLLTLFQQRFATLLVGLLPLLGGEIVALAFASARRRWRPRALRVIVGLLLLGLVLPFSLFWLRPASNRTAHPGFVALRQVCGFLQAEDSSAVDYPALPSPDSGVLARWDYGHWVVYYCGMPTVTSPMTASLEARVWNAGASRLFYQPVDEALRQQLSDHEVRYIVAPLPTPSFQTMAESLGIEQSFMRRSGEEWTIDPALYETLVGRLFFSAPESLPPWLELIFASAQSVALGGRSFPILVVAQVHAGRRAAEERAGGNP